MILPIPYEQITFPFSGNPYMPTYLYKPLQSISASFMFRGNIIYTPFPAPFFTGRYSLLPDLPLFSSTPLLPT